MNHQGQNNFLHTDMTGYGGGLTPLVSPVARFTFSNTKTSALKLSTAKISLKRDSNEKERRRKFRFAAFSLGPMSELFSRDSLFNPVVQMYDVTTWPSSMRLLSPVQLGSMLLVSLVLAISGLVLWPSGHTYLASLSFLLSLVIAGSLTVVVASVMAKRKGLGLDRLKLRA